VSNFSATSWWKQETFQWDDDNAHFVLDHLDGLIGHIILIFNGVSTKLFIGINTFFRKYEMKYLLCKPVQLSKFV
jgi:hypothetical protein